MLAASGKHDLIVAHFDHGIRPDSADDARFVRLLAEKYHLPYCTTREELGAKASEERARTQRYKFLRAQAKKHHATIVTAHHADDIIETIAINLIRGTGWRGIAILDTAELRRPLLHQTKEKIRAHALTRRLEWVEDSTNAETQYLRNRVRRLVASLISEENRQSVLEIWERQVAIKKEIDKEVGLYIHDDHEYSRYFLTHADPLSAAELLRAAVLVKNKTGATRPQIERALLAVKTAHAGSTFELGGGVELHFKTRTFVVQTP
jgi:tRNA(Ile)-lysidine synthase